MHSPLLESLFEFSVHGFRVSSYKAVAEGTVLIVPEDLGSIGIALWQIDLLISHRPANILKVYIEGLTGFSPSEWSQCHSTLKTASWAASSVGKESECTLQGWGLGE